MKDAKSKNPPSNDSLVSTLLTKLQSMSECSLTTSVLIPLFQSLGYEKVDYHGGPYEGGKDLICWKTDELGLIELSVVQVKKYQPTAKASDKRSFSEIITQLQQAIEKPVPNANGQTFYPTIIYFVTPFQLETRALQSRFEGYTSLRQHGVKIIDGSLLVQLIQKNLPQLANELSGKEFLFRDTIIKNLTNADLLNALNAKSNTNQDISSLYCDLDFVVGKITTKFFFSLNFKPKTIPLSLTPPQWASFKICCQVAQSAFGVTLLSPSEDEIQKDYERRQKKYEDEIRNIKRTSDQKSKVRKENKGNTQQQEPEYIFKLDGRKLAKKLISKQEWLQKQTEDFNRNKPSVIELRKFLKDCEQLFETAERVLGDPNISKSVGISDKQMFGNVERTARLNIPIHIIFNTGLNFAVLGEAGAGKTTSLQMYAKRRLENANESELVLFVPLARVFSVFEKEKNKPSDNAPLNLLEHGIISYLRILGLDFVPLDFLQALKTKRVVFLLDGIDEVIKRAPWMLEAISDLNKRYPTAQIIISSRMCGDYLQKIPFFGITLLPFTDRQREKFIRNWFSGRDKAKVTRILKHLKQYTEIGEILRNPLLTTILCVLAEHDVPLPDSEIRLYEERMRLLLGQYDIHKQVVRLKSYHNHLELVARKLAYQFHKNGVRQAEPDVLTSWATKEIKDRMRTEQITLAVRELIDPCNILIPMTEDGQLGFGHLRYQEYLVACELVSNRGLGIERLLYQSWWRGALVLFAQMTDDIEFIIDWVVRHGKFSDVRETLEAMLAVQPWKKRRALSGIVTNHLKLDKLDLDFEFPYTMRGEEEEFLDNYLEYKKINNMG